MKVDDLILDLQNLIDNAKSVPFSSGKVMVNSDEIFDIIEKVSASGTTVLLVEQNAKKALSIADRAYVLETGKIVLSGDANELMNDDSIKKAYLGE